MPEVLRFLLELALGSPKQVLFALGALGVLWLFLRWEHRGRPEAVLAVLLTVIVVDATVYPSQNEVPAGLLRPFVLGQSLRLPDVLIPAALFARLHVRGVRVRARPAGLALAAFAAWHLATLVTGLLAGHPANVAIYHLRGGLYVAACSALAAGVPVERLTGAAVHRAAALLLGVTAAVTEILVTARAAVHVGLPGLAPGMTLGVVGADAATIYVAIGLAILLVESARTRRRLDVVAAGVAMLLMPFRTSQRAALLGLATSVALTLAASAGRAWRARSRVRGGEALLFCAALAVPLLAAITVSGLRQPAAASSKPTVAALPFSETVREALFDPRKQQSAKTRENLWRVGLTQWVSQPLLGTGLGLRAVAERAADSRELETSGYHNVVVDLLARGGLAGLAIFGTAVALAIRAGVGAWRRHRDPLVATLALACVVTVGGLLAKGLVESIFEKYRLAALLGLLVGVMVAAGSDASSRRPEAAP